MRKLMFATALVASAAAFADGPLNAISFEGYSADATFTNGTAEKDEEGVIKSEASYGYFFFEGDADASSVKAFGNGEGQVAAPQIRRPLCFASASPNANYLELSTEGGILWRSINTLTQTVGETTTYDLGEAKPIAADGTYLDTLVQFTPTEDGGAPELDEADKLAIWLNVDGNSVTNLMVRAGFVDDDGTDTFQTPTTYTLTTASPVVPGQWYRLTVKTIADVTQQVAKNPLAYEAGYTGFEIYLDGVLLAATAPAFGQGFIDLATDAGEFGWLDQTDDASLITYLQSGTVFPALGLPTTTYTLKGVGFKGSGALDDIVWTEEDPFAGGAGGDDYKVTIGGSDVIITPQAGDLAALQAAIVAGGGTLDVTDVDAVNAALAAPIPGTSPAIPSWQALFLGVAPTTNGLEQVAIESVTVENGTVTVAMSDDLTLMTGRGVDIVLKVIGSNDLSIWDTANPLATATNTLTIPAITPAQGETKKFYKVVVEFAATPAQN